jgi:hypothetical protein
VNGFLKVSEIIDFSDIHDGITFRRTENFFELVLWFMKTTTLVISSDRVLKETKIAVRNLPLCPEINLFLLEEDYPKEPVSRFESMLISFSALLGVLLGQWTGVIAFLDNRVLVQDKEGLDFGAGQGCRIATAKPVHALSLLVT